MEQNSSGKGNKCVPVPWCWGPTPAEAAQIPPPNTFRKFGGDNSRQGPSQQAQPEKFNNTGIVNTLFLVNKIPQGNRNNSVPTQISPGVKVNPFFVAKIPQGNKNNSVSTQISPGVNPFLVGKIPYGNRNNVSTQRLPDMARGGAGDDNIRQGPSQKGQPEKVKNTARVNPFLVEKIQQGNRNSVSTQGSADMARGVIGERAVQGPIPIPKPRTSIPEQNKNQMNPLRTVKSETVGDTRNISDNVSRNPAQVQMPPTPVIGSTSDNNTLQIPGEQTGRLSPDRNRNTAAVKVQPTPAGSGQGQTQITAIVNKTLRKKSPPKNKTEFDVFLERHQVRASEVNNHLDLDLQLHTFVRVTTMSPNDKEKRDQFLEELLRIIRPVFPECILYPFGSFVTKVGDVDSDVDIFVDAYGMTMRNECAPQTQEEKKYIFDNIHRGLRRSGGYFRQIVKISQARVPIIKLTQYAGLHADLSFENLMSVQNSKMIAFYIDFEPRVRPLVVIIRYWARFHGLSGCNLIKNYGLVLMALVFLMRKKLIPTVHLLQALAPEGPFLIENWNAAFCPNIALVRNCPAFWNQRQPMKDFSGGPSVREVLQLAQEFFDLFANLDYYNQVICSLTGDFLPRQSFIIGNVEGLPEELNRYKCWAQSCKPDQALDIKSALCIQDPFNLRFNVGGCTKEIILSKFKAACVSASAQLTKILAAKSPKLMDLFVPLPIEFARLTKKDKLRARALAQATAAQKAQIPPTVTTTTTTTTTTTSADKTDSPIGDTSSKPPIQNQTYKYDTVSVDIQPTQDYIQHCSLFSKHLVTEFTPAGYLGDLFNTLWLKFMYNFLTTVFQQAYKLEVQIDDCDYKKKIRRRRTLGKKSDQSEFGDSNCKQDLDGQSSVGMDPDRPNNGEDIADIIQNCANIIQNCANCRISEKGGDRLVEKVEIDTKRLNSGQTDERQDHDVETGSSAANSGIGVSQNDVIGHINANGQVCVEPRGHGQSVPPDPELTEPFRRISVGRGRGRGRNPKRQAEVSGIGTPRQEHSTHKILKPSAVTPPLVLSDSAPEDLNSMSNVDVTDSENKTKLEAKSETMEIQITEVDSDSKSDCPEIEDEDIEDHLTAGQFTLHCTGNFQVWEGRKKHRKVEARSGTSESDPIKIEENVTKLILEGMDEDEGDMPIMPFFKFKVVVQIIKREFSSSSIIRLIMTEELLPGGVKMKMNRQALNYFGGNVLKSLSLVYVKYRFDQWFKSEGGKEIIIRAGESKKN